MFRALSLVAACMILSSAALAQQPAAPPAPPAPPPAGGTPDAIPFAIPFGMPVALDQAKAAVAAAIAEARKGARTWKMNIAVVDPAGELVYFEKMDGAQNTWTIAVGKARTAARFRRDTRVFYNAFETGHPYVATLDPTLVAAVGGSPLIAGGKVIGGIGCAGGTGDQDGATCKAGADAIK